MSDSNNKRVSDNKTIIIDFGKISTPYCGLAEVALNYAHALEKLKCDGIEFKYIVPKALQEKFYEHVNVNSILPKYSGLNRLAYYLTGRKQFLCRLPDFDLYHYLHFYSPWGPKPNHAKPVLLTIHDLHALERTRAKKRLQKKLGEISNIAFISNYAAQDYGNYFASLSKDSRVIVNGVKVPLKIDSQTSKKWKHKYSEYLFTLGGLKRKNIHSLLGMLEKNNQFDSVKNLNLVIAGGVKEKYKKELCAEAQKRGVLHKLVFLGPVSECDKFELINACRAFVFPTLQEGFGLPIIEALHFGKPVFSSNKTSLPEVGGDMVYYWENFDADYMSAILQAGLQESDALGEAKMVERKQYACSFDWDNNAREYLDYYLQILQ